MEDPVWEGLPRLGREARDFFADLIGIGVLAVTPKDRRAPEDIGADPPIKLPGVSKAKDFIKGVGSGAKAITIDQALQVLGAQPLSAGDQPVRPNEQLVQAATAIVSRENRGRVRLSDIGLLSDAEKQQILGNIRRDARVRQQIASTAEGQQFLQAFGIQLSTTDQLVAAALADTRAIAPRRDGGLNGVVAGRDGIGNAVVDAITALERLFAANPPDP